jgi:hypothetical protein
MQCVKSVQNNERRPMVNWSRRLRTEEEGRTSLAILGGTEDQNACLTEGEARSPSDKAERCDDIDSDSRPPLIHHATLPLMK